MAVQTLLQEPTVDDMLADPIVRLVMSRDGVEEEELRRIFRRRASRRAPSRGDGRAPDRPALAGESAGGAD